MIAFGGPELLDGVTLQIERGERVCLVGRNGAGKSTIMKILGGELAPDSGEVIRARGARVAFLEQEVPRDLAGTVFDVVSEGLGDIVELLSEYRSVVQSLGSGDNAGIIAGLERVQHLIESSGGWQIQQRVETILSRLGLDPDAAAAGLSGGYKRRVLLARALVHEPDLLLLDEPTNHLDIESIGWLEQFLLEFRGAILFITHDHNAGGKNLGANIKAAPGEVYGAIWIIGNGIEKASSFPNLSTPVPEAVNINVITSEIPDKYSGSDYNGMRNIQVFSYDKQYTAYFNSVKMNVPLGNAFLQNGGTTGWNVLGNNVIGMFIGVGKGTIRNVN